jgi:hypothetical protein
MMTETENTNAASPGLHQILMALNDTETFTLPVSAGLDASSPVCLPPQEEKPKTAAKHKNKAPHLFSILLHLRP